MNIASNAMPVETRAPREISGVERMYWAVRREFWESRAIYLAPAAAGALFLVGFLVAAVHLPNKVRAIAALDHMKQHSALAQPYDLGASLLMGALLLISVFYCVEALQRERRDRSILFWKSLPVSDVITVAAKASIPLFFLPLVTLTITLVMQLMMMMMSSVVLAANGLSVATYWHQVGLFQSFSLLAYHIVTAHVLWAAPIYGWLLLVSGWARRAALLWAFLPPLAVVALEKLLFNTTRFAGFLAWRFFNGSTESVTAPGTLPTNPMTHLTPLRFVSTPGLWTGLALTVVCLAIAVRLRRHQDPI